MTIFTPKKATVDARQFTGGHDTALELTNWITERNGKSLISVGWEDKPDRIMIETSKYEYEAAFPGDWILIDQDDTIDIVRNGVFKDRYIKI